MTKRVPSGCLLWTGDLHERGYAIWHTRPMEYVHRWIYELRVGPIPEGMTIDHICHDPDVCKKGNACEHRRCQDVTHMEVVTRAENSLRGGSVFAQRARQTHCLRGHPLNGNNLYVPPSGGRDCMECRRIARRKSYHKRRSEGEEH